METKETNMVMKRQLGEKNPELLVIKSYFKKSFPSQTYDVSSVLGYWKVNSDLERSFPKEVQQI
jgi:hypothetical protein